MLKRFPVSLALAIALCGIALGASGTDVTAEFKPLIAKYWQAWSTLNPDNAAPMYSKDADAVYFDVAPLRYNGWGEYTEGARKVFADATGATFTPNDDLKATQRGDIVWTTNTFHGTVQQKDGNPMELNGRHTAKTGGGEA